MPDKSSTGVAKHVWYKCPDPCPNHEQGYPCLYCDGGLDYCTVCKKGEVELADTCPGPPSDAAQPAPQGADCSDGLVEKLRDAFPLGPDLSDEPFEAVRRDLVWEAIHRLTAEQGRQEWQGIESEAEVAAKAMVKVQGMDWNELDGGDHGYWTSLAATALESRTASQAAVKPGVIERLERSIWDSRVTPSKTDVRDLLDRHMDALAALGELYHDVAGLINDSTGVYGLHLNGDPAEWGDLLTGGRHEEWLGPAMDKARNITKDSSDEQ